VRESTEIAGMNRAGQLAIAERRSPVTISAFWVGGKLGERLIAVGSSKGAAGS
jgi:hypothetical protein